MDVLMCFRFCILISYICLFGYLFPKSGTTYDLFRLRLDLYPHWMRYFSVILLLAFLVLTIVIDELTREWKAILVASINLCLFLFVFSKEKHEDEFSEHIRFKSFTYAFLSFLPFAGAFGIASIGNIDKVYIANPLFIQIMIGVSLVFSLVYFYYTKYRLLKR